MTDEYFSRFFPAICAGFGLFLAGAANLLMLRRGLLLRTTVTLVVLGMALAAASVLNLPGTTSRTAQLLAIGVGACLLLGCGRFVTRVTTLFAALQRPIIRFGLLMIAGVGVAIGSLVAFERADEAAIDSAMVDLEILGSRSPSVPVEHKATTDQGTAIVLKTPATIRSDAELTTPEDRMIRAAHLDDQVIRRGPVDARTNCHGWVFTGGRFILSPDDVELIVKENGYEEVQEAHPGDLVLYRHGGAIAHSAIIRYVSEGQPVLVESKWGDLGLFLHPADKSPYGTDYVFYRSPRQNHLLVGVGGSAPSAPVRPTMITE